MRQYNNESTLNSSVLHKSQYPVWQSEHICYLLYEVNIIYNVHSSKVV